MLLFRSSTRRNISRLHGQRWMSKVGSPAVFSTSSSAFSEQEFVDSNSTGTNVRQEAKKKEEENGNMFQRVIKDKVIESLVHPDSKLWSSGESLNGDTSLSSSSNHSNSISYVNGVNGINDPVSSPYPGDSPNNADKASVSRQSKQLGIRYTHAYNDPLDEWLLTEESRGERIIKDNLKLYQADPFELSRDEIANMTSGLRTLVSQAGHPVLASAAEYFFGDGSVGKKVRPVMILLLSHAMSFHQRKHSDINVLHDGYGQRNDLYDAQRRLAEISEMIHTASLFHDDVIDESDVRRGKPSANAVFGNKMAILAGDFLLARASICLARLRDVEVVETMSTIIEHLVRGEVMQTKSNLSVDVYLKKNYYKTASLMANSCKSAALLGNYSSDIVEAAYVYGKHVGVAFQLVDDVLDFEGNVSSLGKPVCADLRAGLATAPVLYATEEYPELVPMISRKFRDEGDVERAMEYIMNSQGLARTKDLARAHAEHAVKALMILNQSEHRDALIHLAYKVVDRTT